MRRAIVPLLLLAAVTIQARVISYSPYTDRSAVPAHQHRMNRHFVLVEGPATAMGGGAVLPPFQAPGIAGQLVVYDFLGIEEPKVVYPKEGTALFMGAAVRESSAGVPAILALVTAQGQVWPPGLILSTDGGATWKTLDIPVPTYVQNFPSGIDTGGPFAAARGAQMRIGTDEWPFVVATRQAIYAIAPDGSNRKIQAPDFVQTGTLIGRDAAGRRFLVAASNGELHTVSTETMTSTLLSTAPGSFLDGWIAGDRAYVLETVAGNFRLSVTTSNGARTTIVEAPATALNLFAAPTFDYSGAWIIERGPGKPTILYKHTTAGLVKQWEDITAPEVEALHAGASGTKLLVQVHRPRPQADQRIFQDPALALWNEGEPAPRAYDELYMDEQFNKGFVHLDVEKIAAGEPFVFDSGVRFSGWNGGISPAVPPPSAGGGDVVQEWGVVRASLKQRLVIPAVGRTPGAFGSYWVTDVIINNPAAAPQRVDIRFAPSGAPSTTAENLVRTVTLSARETRLIEDVLASLFGMESGTGAFFIEPESGVTMTSRTYSKSAAGTYGFNMLAMDVFAAAASARFPVTFAGAFLGTNYRTNLVITDAGEHGSVSGLRAAGTTGLMGLSGITFDVAAKGQQQINGIGPMLGVYPYETGALLFQPARGSAIASVFTIDNRTNDTTYFPPDLPAPVVRTIPAIGHVDGANNSRFRSDLYLYNPTAQIRTLTLQVRMWDSPDTATLQFTMLPNEARVVRDALQTMFGRTGIARLRYQSMDGNSNGVRVTSRTYSVNDDGGTYGFLMPPLNNFQSGGPGDTLEILGAVAHDDYRTNIGLVDLSGIGTGPSVNVKVEIVDAAGDVADSFTVSVPFAGGMQLNDVFRSRQIDVRGPVLIRVSPLGGLIGAYATHLDNRTNDASYLGANLGVKP
jgi:hypothetical protein